MRIVEVSRRRIFITEKIVKISRDVFENITEICKESNPDILDSNVAKAHRNGKVQERKSSLFVKLVFVIQ